jgi:hypothetical protein
VLSPTDGGRSFELRQQPSRRGISSVIEAGEGTVLVGEFGVETAGRSPSLSRAGRGGAMTAWLENLIFGHRRRCSSCSSLMTVFMAWQASHLRIDAGFAKLLPLEHEYMKTYLEYRDAFGGANRVVIAIRAQARDGDIFTPSSSRC